MESPRPSRGVSGNPSIVMDVGEPEERRIFDYIGPAKFHGKWRVMLQTFNFL
uniref:Uncharacterized protein n=1 Tax=Moniliophthora roreri TaxID=221103 RepID=A0A0W0GEH1_MONRR